LEREVEAKSRYYPSIFMEEHNNLRIAGVPAEIRTESL
jgi:hypothetical protein